MKWHEPTSEKRGQVLFVVLWSRDNTPLPSSVGEEVVWLCELTKRAGIRLYS